MPPAGFEPATPATKRLQTYVLERAATEVGLSCPTAKEHLLKSETQLKILIEKPEEK
jgi:hypothetical protein